MLCTHVLREFVRCIVLQFVQVANIQLSMSFKRSYYTNAGLRVKKRKVSCAHHVNDDDDDHVLASIAAFVTLTAYEISQFYSMVDYDA